MEWSGEDRGRGNTILLLTTKLRSFVYCVVVEISLAPFSSGPPPEGNVIRALPVHKQAERLGESIICCQKHVDENKKQGF